jgi:hypothetical protein
MNELNLDRLHRVIENAAGVDQEGRTTALLYQMLGCAELGEPNTNWLFITSHGYREVKRVIRLFALLLNENNIPFSFNEREYIIKISDGEKMFHFEDINSIKPSAIYGMLYEAIFDDVESDTLSPRAYDQWQNVKVRLRA